MLPFRMLACIALAGLAALFATGCAQRPEPQALGDHGTGKAAAPSPELEEPKAKLNETSVTAADGLEMTVRMLKDEFLVAEDLVAVVTLKNLSDETFGLFDVDFDVPCCLRFKDADSGVEWEAACGLKIDRIGSVSTVLQPGEAYTAKGIMKLGAHWRFGPYDYLRPGTYEMTLALRLEDPVKQGYSYSRRGHSAVRRFWSGEIKSKPVRFAVRSNRHGTGDPVNQRMAEGFSNRMTEIGEEPALSAKGGDFEAYRMLSFGQRSDHYQLIRIQKEGERYGLHVRQQPHRDVTLHFAITQEEWREFRKTLDHACFWDIPSSDHHRGRDGSHVWIEGHANGERHLVYRWSGGMEAFRACARYLGRLVGRKRREAIVPLRLTVESGRAEYDSWRDVVVNARLHNNSDKAVTLYIGNAKGKFGPQYVSFYLLLWDVRTGGAGSLRLNFMVSGWRKSHPIHITIPPKTRSDVIPLRLAHSTAATHGPRPAPGHHACQAIFTVHRTRQPISSNIVHFRIK